MIFWYKLIVKIIINYFLIKYKEISWGVHISSLNYISEVSANNLLVMVFQVGIWLYIYDTTLSLHCRWWVLDSSEMIRFDFSMMKDQSCDVNKILMTDFIRISPRRSLYVWMVNTNRIWYSVNWHARVQNLKISLLLSIKFRY